MLYPVQPVYHRHRFHAMWTDVCETMFHFLYSATGETFFVTTSVNFGSMISLEYLLGEVENVYVSLLSSTTSPHRASLHNVLIDQSIRFDVQRALLSIAHSIQTPFFGSSNVYLVLSSGKPLMASC
jgi:hypothetical protein